MKVTTTLFLLIILGGVGAYYLTSNPSLQGSGAELASIPVLELRGDDSVSRLEIQNNALNEKMVLKRKGKEWVLESPVRYPAENLLVEGVVQALTLSQRLRRFPYTPAVRSELGFDSPPVKVGVETERQSGQRYLVFGNESPVALGVYARWEGEKEYFVVPLEVRSALERSVYSLREKKVFRTPRYEVRRVHVKIGPEEYRLEKKEGDWEWAVPVKGKKIPIEKASDLIYALESLYIKEFLDGRKSSGVEFGFHPKDLFLSLGGENGERETVYVGKAAEGKDAFYAYREGEGLVFLISEKNLRALLEEFEVSAQENSHERRGKTEGSSSANRESRPPSGRESG